MDQKSFPRFGTNETSLVTDQPAVDGKDLVIDQIEPQNNKANNAVVSCYYFLAESYSIGKRLAEGGMYEI
jgi:hypothetical protein